MRLPLDTALVPNLGLGQTVLDRLQEITEHFNITRELAKTNIEDAQERDRKHHDKNAKKPTFALGDQVLLNRVAKTPGLNPKLQPKHTGPYYITDVDSENDTYILRDCTTHQLVKSRINADRIKIYIDPANREIQPAPNTNNDSDDDSDSDTDHTPNTPVDDDTSKVTDPDPNKAGMTGPKDIVRLTECKYYDGHKWYRTKYVDQRETEWKQDVDLPTEMIRKFHITKTQKGKSRKSKKTSTG